MKTVIVGIAVALMCMAPIAYAQSQDPAADKQMQQWQDRMNVMQQQMDRIHQTKDPKERQKLLEQHWQTMQEQMRDMRMMGGGMMMGMMHGRMRGGQQGAPHMMDDAQRDQMMQNRMDMMQMMMEQMMDHQQMMQQTMPGQR